MSVYNETEYLEESIGSILRQTYTNFEFIIVNDGSNNETSKILEKYSLRDDRIILINNKTNIGLTRSLNKGISYATGEFIARQDADDISLPNRLEKQRNYLELKPNYILVSCSLEKIDSKGRFIRVVKRNGDQLLLEWNLLFFNYVDGHSQVMYRKEQFLKSGGYKEEFIYAQDYELWTRLLKIGKFKIFDDILVKSREHHNQLSRKNFLQQLKFVFQISQHQIETLIDEKITLWEIECLWSFWTFTKIPKHLKDLNESNFFVNNRIKQIYDKFLSQKIFFTKSKSDGISKLIGERYIKWFFYELFLKRRPKLACQHFKYSIKWLGYKTPFFIAKVLSGKFYQLYRRLNNVYSNAML